MFSMTKIKAVNGAGKAFYANHLAANDYYSKKEKVIGIWNGSLAFDFDLLGKRRDSCQRKTVAGGREREVPETIEPLGSNYGMAC